MATPYEFVANQLHTRFPNASVEPFIDTDGTYPPHLAARLYRSGENDEFGDNYAAYNVAYPGGYQFYYPMQLTHPGQRPLTVNIAYGRDYIERFTRPDAEIRDHLAHYGYWRIEDAVDPETTDFWIMMLGLPKGAAQYLILPSSRLKTILSRTHNPERFSLLLAKSGFCFAGQPLSTANCLAVPKKPSLLDTPDNADLKMDDYLNNWSQLLI